MSLIDIILSKLVPFDCLNCGSEGELVCDTCLNSFPPALSECYRCRRASAHSLTCSDCCVDSVLYRATASTIYTGAAKDLVWRLKSSGARSAAKLIAGRMLGSLPMGEWLIVPIPTANSRVRQRGYDQAKLIAKHLSRMSGLAWAACLRRSGRAHQVGSDRELRLSQLHNAFHVRKPKLIQGAKILLVDDVMTTGASFEAAAQVLFAAGARQVEALAFARPKLDVKRII